MMMKRSLGNFKLFVRFYADSKSSKLNEIDLIILLTNMAFFGLVWLFQVIVMMMKISLCKIEEEEAGDVQSNHVHRSQIRSRSRLSRSLPKKGRMPDIISRYLFILKKSSKNSSKFRQKIQEPVAAFPQPPKERPDARHHLKVIIKIQLFLTNF